MAMLVDRYLFISSQVNPGKVMRCQDCLDAVPVTTIVGVAQCCKKRGSTAATTCAMSDLSTAWCSVLFSKIFFVH